MFHAPLLVIMAVSHSPTKKKPLSAFQLKRAFLDWLIPSRHGASLSAYRYVDIPNEGIPIPAGKYRVTLIS